MSRLRRELWGFIKIWNEVGKIFGGEGGAERFSYPTGGTPDQ